MPLINASSFLLYKDQQVIGHSKDVKFEFDVDLTEITNKDSQGFAEYLPLIKGGTASVSGLTAYDDSLNFEEFADQVLTRSSQVFYFKDPNNEEFIIRGDGFIESVDEVSDHESITEFNLKIKLTGVITAGDTRNWENIFDLWENIASEWQNT